MVSVFADNDGTGDQTVERHANADLFMEHVNTLATDKLSAIDGFNKDAYISDLEAIADEITPETNCGNFEPDQFISGVSTRVDSMLSTINTYEKKSTYKDDYLKEVADFFVKEYLKDMKNGVEGITTSTYLEDLDSLKTDYTNRLDSLNSSGSGSTTEYNPADYRDRAVTHARRAGKIDIVWAGVNDHWTNDTLGDILEHFMGKFSSDQVAQADFAWLKRLWGGYSNNATEVYTMNAAYDDNVYAGDWTGKQYGNYSNTYNVDEYGSIMSDDEVTGIYDEQLNNAVASGSKSDGTYNNRSYGYKYANTTKTTIKITTNGHEYSLSEKVYTSPLVLDMDGNGALQASNGKWLPHKYTGGKVVEFDMDGDGFMDLVEWVGPQDGLLVQYTGGEINGNNLFGSCDSRFDHGYEKLSLLDSNNDGVITGEELNTLSVWRDENGNAKADDGEIVSVKELGITSIGAKGDFNLVSSFVQNGQTKKVWDWFPVLWRVKRQK
jgi:hypothetical protein